MVSKYIPLNKSNISICFTASGYQNFSNFAALFGMPASYISHDEDEVHEANTQSTTDDDHEITTLQLPGLPSPPQSTQNGITTEFQTNPNVIPVEEDPPSRQSDQALLMKYHEKLGHCPFNQLKQLAEKNILPHKLAKIPAPKCPSCLYGKAH